MTAEGSTPVGWFVVRVNLCLDRWQVDVSQVLLNLCIAGRFDIQQLDAGENIVSRPELEHLYPQLSEAHRNIDKSYGLELLATLMSDGTIQFVPYDPKKHKRLINRTRKAYRKFLAWQNEEVSK